MCRTEEVSKALTTGGYFDGETETFVTHPLKAEGADASEDGTGRGVPLVAATLRSRQHSPGTSMSGRGGEDDQNLIVFDERNVTSPDNRQACRPGDPVPTLHSSPMAIAGYMSPRVCRNSDSANELGIKDGSVHDALQSDGPGAVAFAIQERAVSENIETGPQGKGWQEEQAFTPEARHHQQAVAYSGVRRLTPTECERLQGFPDGWTDQLSDSARYRCLGNAVSVPVAEWIGKRLMAVK